MARVADRRPVYLHHRDTKERTQVGVLNGLSREMGRPIYHSCSKSEFTDLMIAGRSITGVDALLRLGLWSNYEGKDFTGLIHLVTEPYEDPEDVSTAIDKMVRLPLEESDLHQIPAVVLFGLINMISQGDQIIMDEYDINSAANLMQGHRIELTSMRDPKRITVRILED